MAVERGALRGYQREFGTGRTSAQEEGEEERENVLGRKDVNPRYILKRRKISTSELQFIC